MCRERNWVGEQKMVAADTAAWVRSLPDDNIRDESAGGVEEGGAQGAGGKKKGGKRAFFKALLSGKGAPLPWGIQTAGGS